jgi:two-component system NarL family response regulator
MNPETARILLVDDHRIFREGLRLLILRAFPQATVVGEAGDAPTAIALAHELAPEVVVMDIHMPLGNGIDASRQIRADQPATHIIILSAEPDLTFVREALRAGAEGYLLKISAPEELPRAIRTVCEGRLYLCEEAAQTALEDYREALLTAQKPPKAQLSAREVDVLHATADGLRTKEIAEKLGIGIKTIETHKRRMMKKLACTSTAELVRYAIREGIVRA